MEEQIINQILYQVDSSKIPSSKYEVKVLSNNGRDWNSVKKIASLLLGIFLWIKSSEISSLLPTSWFSWSGLAVSFIGMLIMAIPILKVTEKLINKYKLHFNKISFQGNSLDFRDSHKDVLNDEMRELVYIILASKVHTVVFEDLDRFENIDIFTKLRELNYLVNSNSSKTIRFIYLLRDDLFLQQERTKFFDLIIPVVPVINSKNSSGKMLDLFDSIKDEALKPSTWALESISLYVDDMRLLYSIRNEYEVYSKAIDVNKRKLDPDKLLGMIAFKNMFPKEFDQFQQDKGYVFQVVKNLEKNRQKHIKDLEFELDELRSSVKELQLLTANSKFELMSLYIPYGLKIGNNEQGTPWTVFLRKWYESPDSTYPLHYGGTSGGKHTFEQFYNKVFTTEEYKKKEKLFKDTNKLESIKFYEEEIAELETKLNNIYILSFSEILAEMSVEDIDKFFIIKDEQDNSDYQKDINYALPFDHYFGLIRFLIFDGLLDGTYRDYLGYFYKSSIGINDEIFIRKLRDGTASDERFELNYPDVVKNKLEPKDYKKKGIYNQSLILAVLEDQHDKNHFTEIVAVTLKNENKINSFLAFLDSFKDEQISQSVERLLKEDFDLYWKLLNRSLSARSLHDELLVKAFQNIDMLSGNRDRIKKLREYTKTKTNILTNDDLVNNDSFYEGLEKAYVKFDNLAGLKISSVVGKEIEKRGLYWITIPNIATIYSCIKGTRYEEVITKLLHLLGTDEALKATESRMDEDADIYTREYIVEMNQLEKKSNSTEDTFVKLLNADISAETKNKLITIEKSTISDISLIEDTNLWNTLLEYNRITFTEQNINLYYEYVGVDEAFIGYLNTNSKNPHINKINVHISNKLVQNEKIDDLVFEASLKLSDSKISQLNEKLLTEDKKDRVNKLVQKQKLSLTKENYLSIQSLKDTDLLVDYLKHYKDGLDRFIGTTALMPTEVSDEAFYVMLDNRLIEIDRSKVLLDYFKKIVSLFDIPNAYYEIRNHIFSHYFDEGDIQKVINNNKNFDLWDDFMTKINKNPKFLEAVFSKRLTVDFITKAIKDQNLLETIKIKILVRLVKNKQFVKHWQDWMLELSCKELVTLGEVFDGKIRPKYPEDSDIRSLIDGLIEIRVISKNKVTDNLHFNSTELKKLI